MICLVLGFHSRVDFWLGSSGGPCVYTCLACRSNSWLSLVVATLVTSVFLVTDEGFVSPCVGGGTSICGWLRYLEAQVKSIYASLFLYISVNVSIKF